MRRPSITAAWANRLVKLVEVLAIVAILLSPPVRALAFGALLVPEEIPSPIHPLSALTPAPSRRTLRVGSTTADWYRPWGWADAPGIVLVPGGDPEGKDDPRIVGLAEALARTGRQVLVPQLGLRTQRLDPQDPARVRASISFLAAQTHAKVGLFAISYGGGITLVSLEQAPAIERQVAYVATLGTYFSLFDLLQGVTTHTVAFHGRNVAWDPDPSGLGIAEGQLAALLPPAEGAALNQAWKSQDPAGLAPGPLAAYGLLENRDPSRFEPLEEALPPALKGALEDFSPARSISEVDVPVLALESRNDPASPPPESRLLVEALAARGDMTRLIVVGNLSHLTPTLSLVRDISDGVALAGFGASALGAQEGWPRF